MPRQCARSVVSCASAAAWLGLAVSLARGEPDAPSSPTPAAPYDLQYEGPPSCPSAAAFRDDALSHVHDTSGAAGARVAVRIDGEASGFHGELSATDTEGHVGHRSIDGTTCEDVAHALAFLAGLAIELGGRLAEPEPPAKAEPPSTAAPPPTRIALPAPPPLPVPPPPRHAAFSILALGELRTGLAPVPRPAGEIAFGVEDSRERVLAPSLRVAIVGAQSELDASDGSATLRYLAGRAEGCPLRWGTRRIELRPCVAVEVGYVWAESHAAKNPRNAGQVWPSGEASLRLNLRISGGLFLEPDVAVGVPFLHPRYFFEPDQVLYQVPSITFRAALGLGYRF